MTELVVPDPKTVINELRETCEEQFFSSDKRCFAQLERILVNSDRFVLLLYSLDWKKISALDPTAQERKDSILANALWIREEALKAYRDRRLDSELREALWEKYMDSADALRLMCRAADPRLATLLENAIEC